MTKMHKKTTTEGFNGERELWRIENKTRKLSNNNQQRQFDINGCPLSFAAVQLQALCNPIIQFIPAFLRLKTTF